MAGSLTAIKSHLLRHNIKGFNSLKEVINFQKNYFSSRQEIISNQKVLIEEEKNTLLSEILQLDNAIITRKIEIEKEMRLELDTLKQRLRDLSTGSTSIIKTITHYFKKHFIKYKILANESNINSKISSSIGDSVSSLAKKNDRYQYIDTRFMDVVNESSFGPLKELERKKSIIDEINNYIYGALGEQKVIKVLENLPNEYFLINDFSLTFSTPIYNRQEDDYIKSVQIDHVLISPSGIFLIETKNWSEQSLNNLSLRSPVQQIKRSNFALFILLNEGITTNNLNINQHHWGERKIPIRNLIVLTKVKPNEDFQYVKILTLNELLNYVKYFKPTFSNKETQEITNYLLNLLNKNDYADMLLIFKSSLDKNYTAVTP